MEGTGRKQGKERNYRRGAREKDQKWERERG